MYQPDKTLRMHGMNLNPLILRMLEDTFSIFVAQLAVSAQENKCSHTKFNAPDDHICEVYLRQGHW